MWKKVCILVPVYGVERYIERCARSIFEQTYSNLDYVFVNDCTPDNSIELLKHVMEDYPKRKPFVKIVNHEKNRGLAASRNTALDNASGEFVFHMDSDDWLELDAIESLVKKQEKTGADIVSGNMYVHTNQGIEEYFEPHYDNKEQMLLMQMPITMDHNAIRRIIKRSLYEDHRIRCIEGCNMTEDRYQMIQLYYYANMVSVIDGFVYHYDRTNAGSYVSKMPGDIGLLEQELRNWLGITAFLKDKGEVLYNESLIQSKRRIDSIMNLSLGYRQRERFEELMDIISSNEECMELLGWTRVKTVKHNYYYMLVERFVTRCIRYVNRRFKMHMQSILI